MKTIVVNKKEIEITPFDTTDTFLKRIANTFNTLPYFISNNASLHVDTKSEIKVSFIIEDIEKYEKTFTNFINEKGGEFRNISQEEKLKLWLSYRKDINEEILREELESIPTLFRFNLRSFTDVVKYNFVNDIEKKIKKNSEDVKNFSEIFKNLFNVNSVESLNFKKEKNLLCFTTNDFISLDFLFQKISCDDVLPFACFERDGKEIYKLKPGFDWKNEIDENFFIKMRENKTDKIFAKIKGNSDATYLDLEIFTKSPNGPIEICVFMDYGLRTNDAKIEKETNAVLDKIKDFFSFLNITGYTESNISGIFILPNQRFNNYLLSDMIMLNHMFIYFMTVDERVKSTKQRGGLFTRFFIDGKESTCSIISKKFNKMDQEIKLLVNKKKVPYGSDIVRIRINKSNSMEMVKKCILIITKLFTLYNTLHEKIVPFYKKYIPNFKTIDEVGQEEEEYSSTLKDEVPDLFINGYTRKCPASPIIIDEEDIKEYDENRVMKFPKTSEEGERYNYVCDPDTMGEKYKNNIYIGLRINTLSNKNKYQWIPCCYSQDQTQGKNTGYTKYFSNEKIDKKRYQQNIIVTNKIATENNFAVIPQQLDTFLTFINPKYNYYREGMKQDKQSFLRCILKALDHKDKSVTSQLKKIVEYVGFSVCCQENPEETIENLKIEFSNKNIYMDPRKWVVLLEYFYKCKIFIFSRHKNQSEITLETPYHKNIHLKYKTEKYVPTILIYEHWGSDDENLQNPQCELIVRINSENKLSKTETIFTSSTFIALEKFYNDIFKQYYYSQSSKSLQVIEDFYFPEKLVPYLKSQILDSSGRTRILITKNGIRIGTNPIPPLPIEIIDNSNLLEESEGPTIDEIVDFLKDCEIYLISQFVKNYNVIELTGIPRYPLNNPNPIEFTIKTFDQTAMYQDIPVIIDEKIVNKNSDIDNFFNLQKIASVLQEFFIYKFSIFVADQDINLQKIKNFISSHVIVQNNISYEIPENPMINYIEKIFVKNGKIVIDSVKTLRKLTYGLLLCLSTNLDIIRSYKDKKEIKNFYKNSLDYRNNTKNIITTSLDLLGKINNIIEDKVDTVTSEKYFLKLKPENKKSFISFAVPAKNLYDAKKISYNYNVYKRVKNVQISKNEKMNVKVYIYYSKKKVRTVKLLRKDSQITSNILAYKENGKIYFSSLIPLAV